MSLLDKRPLHKCHCVVVFICACFYLFATWPQFKTTYSIIFHVFKLYINTITSSILCFWCLAMSLHVDPVHLFSVGWRIPLHGYAIICLSILCLMDIYYLNSITVNILMISNFGKCTSMSSVHNLGWNHWWEVLNVFHILMPPQISLQSGCTNLHSH